MANALKIQKAVEFYNIELSQLADGSFRVSITATMVDDEEPQLLSQEIATERLSTVEDVLELIKSSVAS